jgi:hypothetical protein
MIFKEKQATSAGWLLANGMSTASELDDLKPYQSLLYSFPLEDWLDTEETGAVSVWISWRQIVDLFRFNEPKESRMLSIMIQRTGWCSGKARLSQFVSKTADFTEAVRAWLSDPMIESR